MGEGYLPPTVLIMHPPLLRFRKPFIQGYEDPFVRNVMLLQRDCYPRDFAQYPRHIRRRWSGGCCSNTTDHSRTLIVQNMMKEKKTAELVSFLSENGISEVVPLKGVYLLKTLYAETPPLRGMGDIDLLVRRSQYRTVEKLLRTVADVQPWSAERPLYSRAYHEFRVMYKDDLVEIHRGQAVCDLFSVDYDVFFTVAESVAGQYGETLLLPPLEYMVVFFIIHDASAGLSWFDYRHAAEMRMLLAHTDSNRLRSLCERFGMVHLLDLTLFLQYLLFDDAQPVSTRLKWWYALIGVGTGGRVPFSFSGGDRLFKLCALRGDYLKKAFAAGVLALPDLLAAAVRNRCSH